VDGAVQCRALTGLSLTATPHQIGDGQSTGAGVR
jgi:hypothetical protein